MYLLHVLRQRLDFPDLLRVAQEQARRHQATVILIEDMASGIQLIQALRREGLNKIHPQHPEGDKVMRLHVQTPWFEAGNVLLPKDAPWLADYRKELLAFPKTKHDDQVDSTTQALAWVPTAAPTMEIRIVASSSRAALNQELDSYVGSMGGPVSPSFRPW